MPQRHCAGAGARLKAGGPLAPDVKKAPALLAVVLLAASLSGCVEGRLVGEPVPPFELVTSEGARVDETTYLGRWLVLDLMATWCGPCKLEVGHLQEIQRVHGDKVVILSVGADPTETSVDLERFAQEHGATWSYAVDYDGRVGRAMGLRIIPKLVVVDPEGVVALEREGEVLPAAIGRVIDPSAAPPGGDGLVALASGVVAFLLGALAPFNPYRRVHRDSPRVLPSLLALAGAAVLFLLAQPLSGLLSTRATYGSLFLGLVTLAAVPWWWRARRRETPPQGPHLVREAGDRLYEWAPHLAMALVLGLLATSVAGFFAPAAGFLAGAGLAVWSRGRLPAASTEWVGLTGLALAGAGLLAFGARILLA